MPIKMKTSLVITYKGLLAHVGDKQRGLKKPFADAVKYAMRATGWYWRKKYLPKHFTVQAYTLYGYKKRIGPREDAISRSRRIQSKQPSQQRVPLVESGESKRQILGTRKPPRVTKIRGREAYRVLVPITAPKYFYQYNRKGGNIDKLDEVTRTNMRELRSLAYFSQRKIMAQMKRNKKFVSRRLA